MSVLINTYHNELSIIYLHTRAHIFMNATQTETYFHSDMIQMYKLPRNKGENSREGIIKVIRPLYQMQKI